MNTDSATILSILDEVKDPEIPLLSVVDMGIVRGVREEDADLVVTITPTYSGCPAMKMIEDDITAALRKRGYASARVEVVLDPPWTTDWLTDRGRERLKESGIAPPGERTDELVLFPSRQALECPHCGSKDTRLESEFGSTACKALWACNACGQPFDYFKPL
ncbi:MAG: phenylacetate-CoA oxygenase subunit PaaJ [Bdellovibrionales bacterium]|nr:phenylacetate-CoA oxygenase subunit PaaJ [Bdellovibrionales bacterium]